MMRVRFAMYLALSATLVETTGALAEASRLGCVAAGSEASDAEEAICWFARRQTDRIGCTVKGADTCLVQTLRWCKTASLDMPAAGHTCFLANVAAGKLSEAVELSEYLQAPPAPVARCRAALTEPVQITVTSEPAGAEVVVDGVSQGRAPVQVTLKPPFFRQEIAARFGNLVIDPGEQQLATALDRNTCALGQLVLKYPRRRAAPPVTAEAATAAVEQVRETAPEEQAPAGDSQSEGGGIPAWGYTAVGAGVAAGAAVIFKLVGDGQYDSLEDGCGATMSCTDAQIDDSGVATSDTLMVTSAIVAGGLAITTVILAVTDNDKPDSDLAVGISPFGVGLRGRL